MDPPSENIKRFPLSGNSCVEAYFFLLSNFYPGNQKGKNKNKTTVTLNIFFALFL